MMEVVREEATTEEVKEIDSLKTKSMTKEKITATEIANHGSA